MGKNSYMISTADVVLNEISTGKVRRRVSAPALPRWYLCNRKQTSTLHCFATTQIFFIYRTLDYDLNMVTWRNPSLIFKRAYSMETFRWQYCKYHRAWHCRSWIRSQRHKILSDSLILLVVNGRKVCFEAVSPIWALFVCLFVCFVWQFDTVSCERKERFVLKQLSLIHIWRCRRSTLCRSRWSPYH